MITSILIRPPFLRSGDWNFIIVYGNYANRDILKPIVCGVNWDSGTNGEAICQPLLFTNFSQLKKIMGILDKGPRWSFDGPDAKSRLRLGSQDRSGSHPRRFNKKDISTYKSRAFSFDNPLFRICLIISNATSGFNFFMIQETENVNFWMPFAYHGKLVWVRITHIDDV